MKSLLMCVALTTTTLIAIRASAGPPESKLERIASQALMSNEWILEESVLIDTEDTASALLYACKKFELTCGIDLSKRCAESPPLQKGQVIFRKLIYSSCRGGLRHSWDSSGNRRLNIFHPHRRVFLTQPLRLEERVNDNPERLFNAVARKIRVHYEYSPPPPAIGESLSTEPEPPPLRGTAESILNAISERNRVSWMMVSTKKSTRLTWHRW
jgi:hypothetical protein